MSTAPTLPAASGPTTAVLIILMWVAWLAVIVVADFLGFMMFAFADSPGSAKAAKLMIGPMFLWFGVTFVAGVILLIFHGWWQIPLAFALAISPPFLAGFGYQLLKDAPSISVVNTMQPPAPPAPRVAVPSGGFKPTITVPTQPDFRSALAGATTRPEATTRPATQNGQ